MTSAAGKLHPLKVRQGQASSNLYLRPDLLNYRPADKSACRCKKEQHAERKPHKNEPPEWTESVGIQVARSDQWEGCLPAHLAGDDAAISDRVRSACPSSAGIARVFNFKMAHENQTSWARSRSIETKRSREGAVLMELGACHECAGRSNCVFPANLRL
jgi:hypothetical protein